MAVELQLDVIPSERDTRTRSDAVGHAQGDRACDITHQPAVVEDRQSGGDSAADVCRLCAPSINEQRQGC